MFYFFFNDTATTDIYTLSLHDALPIFRYESHFVHGRDSLVDILKERGLLSESDAVQPLIGKKSSDSDSNPRSEERFSRNAETDLVCRLLLEKKKELLYD